MVDELRVRSVSDTMSSKFDLAHRTLSGASWTQNTQVDMS